MAKSMEKIARAFPRGDRARGKRWLEENHCGRAAKRVGRVSGAAGGRSEWVFRLQTVPKIKNKKREMKKKPPRTFLNF